jgi:signal transduction histidine kinase
VNRRDSARPARPSALLELERLTRQLGQPDQGLLDAASETLQSASPPLDLSGIPKFVEDSADVCIAAQTRWRDCSPEQRALLRGCSLDLIALAADQVLRLDRTYTEYRRSETDVQDAAENLASALERAEALAEQARSVIQTVSGVSQQGVAAEVDDRVAAFSSAIQRLRETATELLERGSPGVRKRCSLYALDQSYVQTLDAALSELADLARKASDAAAVARKKVQVERTLACAGPLIEQVVHAFEHATRLDRSILPVRAVAADTHKRATGDAKGRGTVALQKTAIMHKPPGVAAPKHVERLVLGAGAAGDQRLKR